MEDVLSIPSVTGIDLQLRIAGPGARSYAFIIDWHFRVLAALAWFAAGTLLFFGSFEIVDANESSNFLMFVVIPSAAIYFLYHPVIELLMAGRTPGKRIAGVRIVRLSGEIPGLGAILVRNVFRLIDSLPALYCLGLGFAIFTRHSVRIGDIAAGTVLVYDEPEDKSLGDFSGEAIGRIGMARHDLIRDLLARWDHLQPATRDALAGRLLSKLGVDTQYMEGPDMHDALRAELARDTDA